MNKIFFSLIIFCVFYSFAKAQDTIVKVGGSKIFWKIEREDTTNVYFINEVNGKEVKTFLQKTDILTLHYYNVNPSKTMSDYELFRKKKTPDIASLGIGFGLDYGGVGANEIHINKVFKNKSSISQD